MAIQRQDWNNSGKQTKFHGWYQKPQPSGFVSDATQQSRQTTWQLKQPCLHQSAPSTAHGVQPSTSAITNGAGCVHTSANANPRGDMFRKLSKLIEKIDCAHPETTRPTVDTNFSPVLNVRWELKSRRGRCWRTSTTSWFLFGGVWFLHLFIWLNMFFGSWFNAWVITCSFKKN